MIGFILGTSEGRKIVSLMNEFTDNIAVSTATSYGGQLLEGYKIKELNTKPLNKEEMIQWFRKNNIHTLVDGSHPYAAEVTKNAMECCRHLGIKYIRYERKGVLENDNGEDIIRVNNYDEAIKYIKLFIKGNILNTTGGNNVTKFVDMDFDYRVIHRILPSPLVLNKIVDAGVKIKDIIAMQGPISCDLEKAFIQQFDVKAIITKDSGIEGGVIEKVNAARECGIKIIVIEKTKFQYDIEFNDPETLVEYLKEL
ncbi:MAG: cobalt-precorrin-6A reductase [Clostridium butyricum]|nr:cobalt-precorrin-6A reductase [Clostridium butyricum]